MKRAQVFRLSMAHPGDLSALEALITGRHDPRRRCRRHHRQDRGQWRGQRLHPRLFHANADGAAVDASEEAGLATDQGNSVRAVGRHRGRDEPALQRVLHQRRTVNHAAIFLGACDWNRVRAGRDRRCRKARPCRECSCGRAAGDRKRRHRETRGRAFRAGQMPLRHGGARFRRDRRGKAAAHLRPQPLDGLCPRRRRLRRRARARRDQTG